MKGNPDLLCAAISILMEPDGPRIETFLQAFDEPTRAAALILRAAIQASKGDEDGREDRLTDGSCQ